MEAPPNPYLLLAIDASASADDLKKAYRQMAAHWHPDRNNSPDAPARFRAVKEAYELLCDAGRRAELDRQLKLAGRPLLEPLMDAVYTQSGRARAAAVPQPTFDVRI